MTEILTARAPAKVNLSLHVLGRRSDGYHLLDSFVAFSGFGDVLHLTPGKALSLSLEGPTATATGAVDDNLVLRAVRALQVRYEGIRVGAFHLIKHLPVAAGIGGGSSDAAAALRLIARVNDLAIDDSLIVEAAQATGADVPVCLTPRASQMSGIGEIVERIAVPFSACAVLVNPRVSVSTPDVFRALKLSGNQLIPEQSAFLEPMTANSLFEYLEGARNDLEAPALSLAPAIGGALSALHQLRTCRLARMSGSGATVFGLFATPVEAAQASCLLRHRHPSWWVRAAVLR